DRIDILCDGLRRWPRDVERRTAECEERGTQRDLSRADRDARATASIRSGEVRSFRLRQAGKLFRAAGRALVEAISRFGNARHSGNEPADRMAAADDAATGAHL